MAPNKGHAESSTRPDLGDEQAWHTRPAEEAMASFETRPRLGLTQLEVEARLKAFGPNRLRDEERRPFWEAFLEELKEPLILLLIATGVAYAILSELSDALTIFFVILALNTIEVLNERRAKRAIAALQQMAEPIAHVVRDGRPIKIPSDHVVPGDLVLLEAGRRVPADGRLTEGFGLAIDESSLTGESVPVDKDAHTLLDHGTPLAERSNMAYAGTLVTRGRGTAIAVCTGTSTALGRVAELAREVEEPRTPLQRAMDGVSKSLVWIALGFSVLVPVLGVLIARLPFETMLLTGLSLAFATIPEEMPIIITMVLALGAYRLSRQNAIARNLKSVETLGAVTVIATDKTGTLTENRMVVNEYYPFENRQLILSAAVLASNVRIQGDGTFGDPMEIALLRAAEAEGIDLAPLRTHRELADEFAFDNQRKRMSMVYRNGSGFDVWVKGAPESLLAVSNEEDFAQETGQHGNWSKEAILEAAESMADRGMRVIAFASKETRNKPASFDEAESGLRFLGLVGLSDPPRQEVKGALRTTQEAGIRTIMITGDHPATARAIAAQIGLDGKLRVVTGNELDQISEPDLDRLVGEVSIFARTTPEHKLRIVRALGRRGERVAVTGDGVNDAPALAAADIGVAMGKSGSDVAREAGDIVLADDNFTTIANAVHVGRALFANLKKGVRYYLAIKVALVSIMLLPVSLSIPVPFAPIQIILMELFMDLAAAAAFVAEPPEGDLMRQPPRDPNAHFMDRAMITSIFTSAAGLFLAVSAVYLTFHRRGAGIREAQTAAFAAWMLGHVFLAFNMRSERQPLSQLGVFSNRLMVFWGLGSIAFLILVTALAPLQDLLKTTSLGATQWLLIVALALLGTTWLEPRKLLTYSTHRQYSSQPESK